MVVGVTLKNVCIYLSHVLVFLDLLGFGALTFLQCELWVMSKLWGQLCP